MRVTADKCIFIIPCSRILFCSWRHFRSLSPTRTLRGSHTTWNTINACVGINSAPVMRKCVGNAVGRQGYQRSL
jgi:hypothetical protein